MTFWEGGTFSISPEGSNHSSDVNAVGSDSRNKPLISSECHYKRQVMISTGRYNPNHYPSRDH